MIDVAIESIVHPTDFSRAGLDAFAHALRIAAAAKSVFYLVHIESDAELDDWGHFPRVREMLAKWEMIAPDAPRFAVAKELGLRVEKRILKLNDPVRGVGTFVEHHPCDLLVLMTHARSAPQRWLHGSVAEAAARRARARTLFLREDQRGFVDRETGAISLRTILMPIDDTTPAWGAWRWVTVFKQLVAPKARVHLLHVGSSTPVSARKIDGAIDVRQGPVVETIVGVASEIGADMIVMPTAGHDGLLDVFRGGVTERVLHEALCPLLAIPAT